MNGEDREVGGSDWAVELEESAEFAKVRAIVREEIDRFKDDLFAGFAALIETRAGVVDQEQRSGEVHHEKDVLAVFNEASLKDPDQCQSSAYLAKRTKLNKAQVEAALSDLERDKKVYSRPYFKARLWYLVGHGPGPVKAR